MASADLHGLGADDGPAIAFTWTPPSPLPRLLPWLVLLGLLALRSNRTVCAWWIWLPLLCLIGFNFWLRPLFGSVPSEMQDFLGLAFEALAFGFAAVWLLAAHLRQRLRFLVFLKMLVTMAGVGVLTFLARLDWGSPFEAMMFLMSVGFCALVATAALSLAGWICRAEYRPVALMVWLAALSFGIWLLIVSPFWLVALIAGEADFGADLVSLIEVVTVFAGFTYAIMLPFLVLAFANRFYRDRLKDLLHLGANASPPVLAPAAGNVWEAR